MCLTLGYLAKKTVWSVFTGVPCWKWAPIDLTLLTSLLFRTNSEKTSNTTFPVQFIPAVHKWCARPTLVCVFNSSSFLELRSPATSTHTCVYFLQGDRGPLLSVRASSAAELRGLSLGGKLALSLHNRPADEKKNKSRGRHCSSPSAAAVHIFFIILILYPRPLPFSSIVCGGDQ